MITSRSAPRRRHERTTRVCIGIAAGAPRETLLATLASLRAYTLPRAELLLLPEAASAAGLNRLVAASAAPVVVLLEGGVLVGPGWLDLLLGALDAHPRNGIAGPSTNRGPHRQALYPDVGDSPDEVLAAAVSSVQRFGCTVRALDPGEGPAAFCYALRREVFDAVGPAQERSPAGTGWELAYNARAAEAGYRTVWARGAFVYRAASMKPFSAAPTSAARRRLRTRLPLVTCIMPTRDRPEFALQAVRCFQRQDYPTRELVIVDDGREGLAGMLPADARIEYVRSPRPESVGAKRNRACEHARGEIVAHWDDDDWHGPGRLSAQVEPLLAGDADLTGLAGTTVFDLQRWQFWACTPELDGQVFLRGVHGATLAYRRGVWEHVARFPNRSLAEDARFLARALRRGCRLTAVDADGLFLYVRHAGNTWSFPLDRELVGGGWRAAGEPPLPPDDREFYAARAGNAPEPRPVRRRPRGGPLVTCIMPTADRRALVPRAIRCFAHQDYRNRELVVVDDGADQVGDLVADDTRIRYVPLARRLVLGEKRNLACDLARGEIIVHWDDDDWMAPWRLRYQVEALERREAAMCGTRRAFFYDSSSNEAWLFEYAQSERRRLVGSTLCYRKELWSRRPFSSLAVGEDTRFVRTHFRNAAILEDHRFFVGFIHAANTSPKRTDGLTWTPHPAEDVRRLLASDPQAHGARGS